MTTKHGDYLGGIRCLDTLRDRCVIRPSDDCWHLRMPRTGKALPQRYRHAVHVHGIGRMSATRAAWMLAHGSRPPRGIYVARSCGSYDCVNPQHLKLATPGELLRSARSSVSPEMWAAKHRAGAIAEGMRRTRLTREQVLYIRHSDKSASQCARELGIAMSHAINIRAGRALEHV